MSRLLDQLLTWSRTQQGTISYKPEKLDLLDLAMNTIELFDENASQKNISIRCDIKKGDQVLADHNMTETIFRNLISNAVKFTHPGGAVTITACDKDKFIEIVISDNGIGISEEQQQQLFRIRDNKTSNIGTKGEKGTGLGLVLCKEFVEKHGGNIRAEKNPGQGSKFIFTLPKFEK